MTTLYTIGYSAFKINTFIETLKKYKISCLVDVRSNPNSKFFVDYNKSNLESTLKKYGIIYRNYTDEFGARQLNPIYHKKGYLDFEEFVKSDVFLEGLKKIQAGIELNYTFVFMCAEKDPSTCHRTIMVARAFHELGYDVKNILSNGSFEPQSNTERRLVNQYFPNRNQISLLSDNLSWSEMVNQSYAFRNEQIGYKLENKSKEVISS